MACSTSGGVPTCMWGNCVNETKCECFEGYVDDELLPRYNNCSMSLKGFYIYGGFAFALCVLGAIVNGYVGRTTLKGSLLRNLSVSACLTNIFFSAFMADLLVYRHATVQTLVFYVCAVFSTCFAFSYLFLSVLLPVSRINRTIAVKFIPWRRFWLYFIPAFVSTGLIIAFLGAFVFTPYEDRHRFNSWIVGQSVLFIVVVVIATPAFTSFTGILIKGLQQALDLGVKMDEDEERSSTKGPIPPVRQRSSTNNDADFGAATANRQVLVKELLEKVVFIRKAVLVGGVTLMALAILTFTLQMAYQTVPLFWAIFISGPSGISVFMLEIAWYTRKKRESEKRRSTLIPFLADIGRQISTGLKHNSLRGKLSRFGSSRGSKVDENNEGDKVYQFQQPEFILHYRQPPDVPSTVNEEPSQLVSWDGQNKIVDSMRVKIVEKTNSNDNTEQQAS